MRPSTATPSQPMGPQHPVIVGSAATGSHATGTLPWAHLPSAYLPWAKLAMRSLANGLDGRAGSAALPLRRGRDCGRGGCARRRSRDER